MGRGILREALNGGAGRALIVEPQPIFGAALVRVTRETLGMGESVWARGCREAAGSIEMFPPDLAVVEIALPDGDGLDLVRMLRRVAPGVRILILSMLDEAVWAPRSLAAGANGYLSKAAMPEEFRDACVTVLNGLSHLSPYAASHVAGALTSRGKRPAGPPSESLSERELQTYRLLGEGLTTRQIAERLRIGIKTVDTYRLRLKLKLGVDNSHALVVQAAREYAPGRAGC